MLIRRGTMLFMDQAKRFCKSTAKEACPETKVEPPNLWIIQLIEARQRESTHE
jgi:hypothetical protein